MRECDGRLEETDDRAVPEPPGARSPRAAALDGAGPQSSRGTATGARGARSLCPPARRWQREARSLCRAARPGQGEARSLCRAARPGQRGAPAHRPRPRPRRSSRALAILGGAGLALGALLLAPPHARATPVHVQTSLGEVGGGYSVARGANCFVVTPLHVVEIAPQITVYDERGNRARAQVTKQFGDVDLALLRVDAPEGFVCQENWQDGGRAAELASDADFLVSRRIRADQSSERKRLFLRGREGTTHLRVAPYGPSDQLAKGDSGSVVYVSDTLVGLVRSVETTTGEALVLRQDVIHGLVGEIVLDPGQRILYLGPITHRRREDRVATLTARDLLEGRGSLRVQELPLPQRPGQPVATPGDADYVVRGEILEYAYQRKENLTYRGGALRDAAREVDGFFGRVLRDVAASPTAKGDRYLQECTVRLELSVVNHRTGEQTSQLVEETAALPYSEGRDTVQREALEKALAKGMQELLAKVGL